MIELENEIPYLVVESKSLDSEPPVLLEAINVFLGILGEKEMSGSLSFLTGYEESNRSIEVVFGYDENGFLTQTQKLRFDYLSISSEVLVRKWDREQQKFEQVLRLRADDINSSMSLVKKIAGIAGIKVETEDIEDVIEKLPHEALVNKDAKV